MVTFHIYFVGKCMTKKVKIEDIPRMIEAYRKLIKDVDIAIEF